MKKGILRAAAIAAAFVIMLSGMLAAYAARYYLLCKAVESAGGADVDYHALIHGGALGEYELTQLCARLGDEVVLTRGADGRVWGMFSARSPMESAVYEMRLRGALGMNARANRWAAAQGGRLESDDMTDKVEDMLGVVGDAPATQYRGERSCSARGSSYHAAVRSGECAEYMIAEGYLPVEY